jgi:hypothetical protein
MCVIEKVLRPPSTLHPHLHPDFFFFFRISFIFSSHSLPNKVNTKVTLFIFPFLCFLFSQFHDNFLSLLFLHPFHLTLCCCLLFSHSKFSYCLLKKMKRLRRKKKNLLISVFFFPCLFVSHFVENFPIFHEVSFFGLFIPERKNLRLDIIHKNMRFCCLKLIVCFIKQMC